MIRKRKWMWIAVGAILSAPGLIWILRSHGPLPPAPKLEIKVENFRLLDGDLRSHELERYADKFVVLVAYRAGCGQSAADYAAVRALAASITEAKFFFVETGAEHAYKPGEVVPVLADDAERVSRNLGFSRSGEARVIDRQGRLRYAGSVEGLSAALKALQTGAMAPQTASSGGCAVAYHPIRPDFAAAAKVISQKCAGCHQAGQAVPENLSTAKAMRGWAAMIRETVLRGLMPPPNAEVLRGGRLAVKSFDYALSGAEKRTLLDWIEAGGPGGEEEIASSATMPADAKKLLFARAPDLTYSMKKPLRVPAQGESKYLFTVLDPVVDKDILVEGFVSYSSNRRAIHHQSVMIVPEKLYRKIGAILPTDANAQINPHLLALMDGDFTKFQLSALGREPFVRLPAGTAVFVPKGSRLILENHYAGNGIESTEQAKLGVFLQEGKPRRIFTGDVRAVRAVRLEPGERDIIARSKLTDPLRADIDVFSFQTHMHMRGTAIRLLAFLPGKEQRELVYVQPYFHFKFQAATRLEKPLRIPKGTRLYAECIYDNSRYNPSNPDPKARISHGRTSNKHEMCKVNLMYLSANGERALPPQKIGMKNLKNLQGGK